MVTRTVFPSPVGELHFSIVIQAEYEKVDTVSVPCRGTAFLNRKEILPNGKSSKFPSPVGELHFSIILVLFTHNRAGKFPSPVGELHFSITIWRM